MVYLIMMLPDCRSIPQVCSRVLKNAHKLSTTEYKSMWYNTNRGIDLHYFMY
jgi:hypothetical protein